MLNRTVSTMGLASASRRAKRPQHDKRALRSRMLAAVAAMLTSAGLACGAELAEYPLPLLPAAIAPTPRTAPTNPPKVSGQPRQSTGHPCTYWDQQDIAQYKKALATSKPLQESLAQLKQAMDARIAQPLGIPDAGPNPTTREQYRAHGQNASTIADLGILYALTGEEKYGNYCRDMLLAYARNYPKYKHPEGWGVNRYRSAQDGRLTGQFLEDGFWLMRVSFGYDAVYNLPGWTAADRKLLHDDLLEAISSTFYHPVLGKNNNINYISGDHNRAAICTAGVLMAGYATEDANLVSIATYGQDGTPEHPTGGVLGTHFGPKGILDDGLWNEGAPAYQLGILSCALVSDAEVLWHHGIDLYSFRGGVFKRMLDSALALAYPNPKLTVAALHDSAVFSLLDDRKWLNTELSLPYEAGYRRYQDPRYLPIIRNANRQLSMSIHSGPPSLFLDLPPESETPAAPVVEPANFFAVGYGVLRLNGPQGPNQLIMEYGPSGGHGHPSKLGIDLYALGDCLMPFPGVIFPYQDPMDPKWYWTTLGNCALTVDEKSQITFGELFRYPRGSPRPDARQSVFGPATTLSMQRGWSNTAYSHLGVTLDRALFLTPNYLADLHAAWSDTPHRYDLAWHFRGKMTSDLDLQNWQFPEPVANGYNALTEVRRTQTGKPWSATITTAAEKKVWFRASGGTDTEVITGNGHFFIKSVKEDEFPPTIVQRRSEQKSALFGNAVDISGQQTPYLRRVTQQGGLDAGYALLQVETERGTDLCFAAYRPGNHKTSDLETDAQQAMVLMEGPQVRALYLAGGKSLRVGAALLTRSEPGLACVETLADGTCVVSNPSPTPATVSVTLPALAGRSGTLQPDAGKPADGTAQASPGGECTLKLPPGGKAIFSRS